MFETRANNSRISVWPCDFAPDAPYLASLSSTGCAIYEGDLLTGVESALRISHCQCRSTSIRIRKMC